MRVAISRFLIAAIAFLGALALFGIMLSEASPSLASGEASLTRPLKSVGSPGRLAGDAGAIVARRAISIPFGIDSPLYLGNSGRLVTVAGHGDCTGGESYSVRVTVSQAGVPAAVGHGYTEGACPEGAFQWAAVATVNGNTTFEEGEAQVCASAVVREVEGRTVTYHWCRDVMLASRP